jgi:hypothetical protein
MDPNSLNELLPVVVTSMATYLWTRAQGIADRGADALGERLYRRVAGKLGADPALARLEADNSAAAEAPVVGELTGRRVIDSLAQAAEDDPGFGAELTALARQLPTAAVTNSGGVRQTSVGGGINIANTGVVHGGINHR